jgi:hypothetical protein
MLRAVSGAASKVTVNSTAITGGTDGNVLYDNAGTVGEFATVPTANGGTGQSSYTKGDLLAASASTTLAKVAVGVDGQALAADSSKSAGVAWVNLTLRSYIAGCTLSNNGGTPNTKLDVAAGLVCDDSVAAMMTITAGTIDCTTTGANGLDAGSLANSTWYHVYAIGKANGATPALLASTSASSPTMPATYTLKRRIGSFKTDGSAHIIAFTQVEDTFCWTTSVRDLGSNDASDYSAGTLITLTVPTGVQVRPLTIFASGNGSDIHTLVSSPSQGNQAPANLNTAPGEDIDPANYSTWTSTLIKNIYTDTSARVYLRASASGSIAANAITHGWIDSRGRFA